MKVAQRSRLAAKLAVYALFVVGALVLVLLPVNKYSWMLAMDPGATLPPDDGGSARALFALFVLVAVVAGQLALLATAARRRERLVPLVLILIAVALWASRLLR